MRFVILGAGALGCVFGGRLAQADHDVTLVARGEQFTTIKNDGLMLLAENSPIKLTLRVVDDPRAVKKSDVAFVTVKAQDTAIILHASKHLFDKTVFVSFQNSGEKDELLRKYVGEKNVIGGASMVGATLVRPGYVEETFRGKTWVGELPRGTSERVRQLSRTLSDAGLSADATANITSVKWAKLIQYCAFASISALTRLRLYDIMQDQILLDTYVELLREGIRVMQATGVKPDDYRGLPPIKKIMELPKKTVIQEYRERSQKLTTSHEKVSMLQDVLRKKPTEADATLGFVIKKAAENGIDTPAMKAVYAAIHGLETSYSKAQGSDGVEEESKRLHHKRWLFRDQPDPSDDTPSDFFTLNT